jgi:hypothetical protein
MLENTLLRAESIVQVLGQDADMMRRGLVEVDEIRRDLEALRHEWWFERNRSAADIAIQRFVQNIVDIRGYQQRAFLAKKTGRGTLPLAVAYDIDGHHLAFGCFSNLDNGLVRDLAERVHDWRPFAESGLPEVFIVTADSNATPETICGIQVVQAVDLPALLARRLAVAAQPA